MGLVPVLVGAETPQQPRVHQACWLRPCLMRRHLRWFWRIPLSLTFVSLKTISWSIRTRRKRRSWIACSPVVGVNEVVMEEVMAGMIK